MQLSSELPDSLRTLKVLATRSDVLWGALCPVMTPILAPRAPQGLWVTPWLPQAWLVGLLPGAEGTGSQDGDPWGQGPGDVKLEPVTLRGSCAPARCCGSWSPPVLELRINCFFSTQNLPGLQPWPPSLPHSHQPPSYAFSKLS